MKIIKFKNAAIIILLLAATFNLIANSQAATTTSASANFNASGSITYPTSKVQLTYSSSPIEISTLINGISVSNGNSIQITEGSTISLIAGQAQNYIFTNWLINNIQYTPNPLTIEILEDTNIIATYTSDPQSESQLMVGINIWSGTSTSQLENLDIPLLKEAGITSIRTGTGISTRFVDTCLENGISVIGTLSTSGLPDLTTFGNNVYNKVSQFVGKVDGWVVLNEANTNYYDFSGDVVEYTNILKVAYTRAKEADPNTKIITTNALGLEDSGTNFLQGIYNNGGKGYFDVVGIDPYCYPESPQEPNLDRWGHSFWNLPTLHDIMVSNGDENKPIWIIEFGYRTPSSQYPISHWSTCTEQEQGEYIVQAIQLAQTWEWCERFYIYEWMDSADESLGYWGLIRNGYTAPYDIKPAYYTVKEFLTN